MPRPWRLAWASPRRDSHIANEYTPTQAAQWLEDVWTPEIEPAAYEEMRVEPYFDRLGQVGTRIHFRKHANLTRQSPADSAVLVDTLTYSGATEVDVEATPVTQYVAVAVNLNTIARLMKDPQDTFRRSIEMSLGEGVDVECAKKIDDLVNVVGGVGQNVTEATFLDALVTLGENAKGNWKPGTTRGVFIFHTRQVDDIIASTQNWSQYQIRGDQDNPVSKGWLKSVYGVDMVETGNIQNIGGLYHNGLFIPKSTFGIGYNQTPTVKLDDRNLGKLVIGWVDFAVMTKWDIYGVDYQTQTAA